MKFYIKRDKIIAVPGKGPTKYPAGEYQTTDKAEADLLMRCTDVEKIDSRKSK